MAYLRSKSSENRVKAGVGAKTRSGRRFFHVKKFTQLSKKCCSTPYKLWYNKDIRTQEFAPVLRDANAPVSAESADERRSSYEDYRNRKEHCNQRKNSGRH